MIPSSSLSVETSTTPTGPIFTFDDADGKTERLFLNAFSSLHTTETLIEELRGVISSLPHENQLTLKSLLGNVNLLLAFVNISKPSAESHKSSRPGEDWYFEMCLSQYYQSNYRGHKEMLLHNEIFVTPTDGQLPIEGNNYAFSELIPEDAHVSYVSCQIY